MSFFVYGDGSESLWRHLWITPRFLLVSEGDFGTVWKPFVTLWDTLGSLWGEFRATLGGPASHYGVVLASFWSNLGDFGVTSRVV